MMHEFSMVDEEKYNEFIDKSLVYESSIIK